MAGALRRALPAEKIAMFFYTWVEASSEKVSIHLACKKYVFFVLKISEGKLSDDHSSVKRFERRDKSD